MTEIAGDVGQMLVEGHPLVWLRKYGYIRKKDGTLSLLEPNPLQERLGTIIRYMLKHELPVRLLIYKPRQKGSSTVSMALADWWIKKYGHKGYLVGNDLSNCRNLWDILRRYNVRDEYDWRFPVDVRTEDALYGNGGSFHWASAKNAEAGRSATLGVLIMTEIARWAEGADGVRDASKVFSGLMGSVPNDPNTLVIGETTVRGASGVFYNQWGQAREFEDLLAGNYQYGDFIRVFMPWFVFQDSYIEPIDKAEDAALMSGIGAITEEEALKERELISRYGLKAGNIKYWRIRLKECDYDTEERDREEPTTQESGFFAAQPNYFSKGVIRMMRTEAEAVAGQIDRGSLEWNAERDGVSFLPIPEEEKPLWMVAERPTVRFRYIIGVDNSRGIEISKGKVDNHAVVVMRDGYLNAETGVWNAPKVVAALRPKWHGDIDLLAEEIYKLAKWYGGCLTVPEANNDCGLIRELRKLGVSVIERKRPATDKEDSKPTGKFGIWTSDDGQGRGMRSQFLNELRRGIRTRLLEDQEGIDVPFMHIVDELDHFVVDPDTGKAAAMEGHHDDFVIALMFAFYLRAQGNVLREPKVAVDDPPDLKRMLRGSGGGRRQFRRGAHRV